MSLGSCVKLGAGLVLCVYVLFRAHSLPVVRRALMEEELMYSPRSADDTTYRPKISLITVWNGASRPNYLTWFVDSIARQPDEVELIVIQRGKTRNTDLTRSTLLHASNIKVVRMSDDRYWELHRKYLCTRWGGCSEGDKRRIDHHLRKDGEFDPSSHSLALIRGEVFKGFIHPSAEWWGWCDLDTVMGSFKRKFPWDIAKDYDVILPAHRNQDKERTVFMRGHLAFFRNSEESARKITGHPHFSTKQDWLNMKDFHYIEACRKTKTLGCSPKEASYSSYVINNPNINFLFFDALANRHHLALTSHGTYTISGLGNEKNTAHIAERMMADIRSSEEKTGQRAVSTFSSAGHVRPITLIQGNYSGTLWYHPSHSTHVVPAYGEGIPGYRHEHYLTYILRLNGRTEERLEPVSRGEPKADTIEEWLYIHWQEEKKKDWFKALPERTIGGEDNRMMVTDGHGGASFYKLEADTPSGTFSISQET